MRRNVLVLTFIKNKTVKWILNESCKNNKFKILFILRFNKLIKTDSLIIYLFIF